MSYQPNISTFCSDELTGLRKALDLRSDHDFVVMR